MNGNYDALAAKLSSLLEGVPYLTANLANASALLWQELEDINWVGFYQMIDGRLVLGPFQGKPACIQIPVGKGVCGTAVAEAKVQRVENVHAFPGHIACDGASNSEIVLPLYRRGQIWGVLDIDSPLPGRFTRTDEQGLVEIAAILNDMISGIE
ncbi:MAG: GAF domain-containing protein [Faecousia sp.]